MLKTIYKNCAGIDVHKTNIVVRIAKTDDHDVTEYQLKTFSTMTDDLIACREWLVQNETFDVCMESTGKYWIPVFNVLEEKCHCVLTHPKYVKSISGKKTDKRDSLRIVDLFKYGLVEPSFIPPADIRQLRDLMRYRNKLVNMRSSEKNRFQNSLTVSNIQIANVVTDVFGKTSQSILKLMLEKPNLTLDDIKPLLVQCALSAIKDNSCPYIRARYQDLKSRRDHKKAIIAIARLLLTSIYHILKTGEPFDYERFIKLQNRNYKSKRNIYKTPEDMINYLTSLGYNVTK